MTSQALEEKPAAQTISEGESQQASEEANRLTAPAQGEQQQQSDPQGNEEENQAPPDPRQQRVQALTDAEREEAEQRGEERALARLQNNSSEQQREQQKQRVRSTYITEMQSLDNLLQQGDLSASEYVNRAKNALNNLNKVSLEVAVDTVADDIRNIAYGLLPKAAQDTFTQLTSEENDLPTYLNHWVETAALHTKAVKSMSLEDAVKASPKLKREVEAAKLASYDEGREQGRLDPPGTSPDGGRSSQRSAPGSKSYADLESGYAAGTNSKAEDAEYLKMRDSRKRS